MNISFIIKLLIFCGLVLSCYSCKEKNQCGEIKKPKDLKPIDWENYNDVYTVYWNYAGDCSDMSLRSDLENNIKVFGWIFQGHLGKPIDMEMFSLIDNETNIFAPNPSVEKKTTSIYVRVFDPNLANSLKTKFAETDITKKCYIKGKLFISAQYDNNCCFGEPFISVSNINDIYFE